MMRWILAAAILLPQDDSGERLVLTSGEEMLGSVSGFDADGSLRFRTKAGRLLRIPIERVHRLQFQKVEAVQTDPRVSRIQFVHGTSLAAPTPVLKDGLIRFHAWGTEFRVRRDHLRTLHVSPLEGPMPEVKEDKRDIAILEEEKKASARYGTVESLDETELALVEGNRTTKIPRASVRRIHFQVPASSKEVAPGWFARALMRNGDRIVGVLSDVGEKRIELFSHVLGRVSLEKSHIHSIAFLPYARSSVGNLLISDQTGVKEFDRSGRELWSFATNAQYSWMAVKLDNGNVLIANTNQNQVVEVDSNREVKWQLDGVNYPYDVQRLENGNTLVAEYYGNRVCEYDPQKTRVWTCAKVPYPIGAQRLENGNTLITGSNQVVEVDRNGNEVWRAKVDRLRAWRASRLDNGHTLISDYQRGMVLEIDSANREVWRKEGLSRPMAAVRAEDGNTWILEQGANRVIEVDPAKKVVCEIKGLSTPQGLSCY